MQAHVISNYYYPDYWERFFHMKFSTEGSNINENVLFSNSDNPNSSNCNNENAKIPPNHVGAMRYDCETNGDFRPMQIHGSTGERWCVNTKTGNIIQGTLRIRGQPDPICEG